MVTAVLVLRMGNLTTSRLPHPVRAFRTGHRHRLLDQLLAPLPWAARALRDLAVDRLLNHFGYGIATAILARGG